MCIQTLLRSFRGLLCGALLLLLCCGASYAASLTDIAAADTLYELGLFRGTGTDADGKPVYELDRDMTRQEALTMFVRLLGAEDEALAGSWETPFTDVDAWALPYVGYAYANGLTKGVGANAFGSGAYVTQTQYLTFVLRALGYEDGTDFQWDQAIVLAREIGLEDQIAPPFRRCDAVRVSYNALALPRKDGGECLLGALEGKPADARLIPPCEKGFLFTWEEAGEAVVAWYACDRSLQDLYRVPAAEPIMAKMPTLKLFSSGSEGWYYGPEGLYQLQDGRLAQRSPRAVGQLLFYRQGPVASAPVILSFDRSHPTYNSMAMNLQEGPLLGGCDVIEIAADGSEYFWLDSAWGAGFTVDEIFAEDSVVCCRVGVPLGMMHYDYYTYALLRRYDAASASYLPQIVAVSYTPGRPEILEGWDPLHPEAQEYVAPYLQAEQQRLRELGLAE